MDGPYEGDEQQRDLKLVLLPGSLCDERVFEPLIERLPGVQTQVILSTDATSIEQAARHVLALAPPCFALLGFSLGGMVAMQVATQAPDRTSGLALISTSPLPVPERYHAARRNSATLAATMPMETFVHSHLWPGYCGTPDREEAQPASLMLLQRMAGSLGADVFCRQTEMALLRPDFRPTLGNVLCPSLVLAGQQDRLCPPEAQHALATGLSGSTLCMVHDAGHLALLERPDEVAQAVAAWFHTVLQQQATSLADTAARQESE